MLYFLMLRCQLVADDDNDDNDDDDDDDDDVMYLDVKMPVGRWW